VNDCWLLLVESNTTGTGRDFAEAARRHGLRPVLLTATPWRYPYAVELELDVVRADTGDVDAVVRACQELGSANISGVVTSSDLFVHTAAVVARRLGHVGPDPDAVATCRDKAAQRRRLASHGVPVPDFSVCATVDDVVEAASVLGTPVVVKPSTGTGSRGVRLCEDPATAGAWARHLFVGDRLPPSSEVLVETEVHGPEYSVEVIDGTVVGITGKHVGDRPYFVETGHDFPAGLRGRQQDALISHASAAVRAVGLNQGPAHVEVKLRDEQPVLIEINPRLAGGLIPRLIQYATGRDMVDEVVARAAGRCPLATSRRDRHAAIRFLLPRAGVVTSVSGLDRARSTEHVVDVVCTASQGAQLTIEHSFADRHGHVITVADRPETAVVAACKAHACIQIMTDQ
jgi:biotin carboxylase